MPELPEVETIRRGLAEHLPGQTITGVRVRQAQLRHLVDVVALQEQTVGRTITSVDRRAKYLLVRLQPVGVHGALDKAIAKNFPARGEAGFDKLRVSVAD